MNELQIFNNSDFGEVRILEEDDKVLFCAKDMAQALGYKDTINAIKKHCRWVVKRHLPHPQNEEKTIDINFIPESDVYRLIASSKLPSAEKFERWVFDEVLPSIRKHGGYLTEEKIEEALLNPDILIRLATDLKNEREARRLAEEEKAQIEEEKVWLEEKVKQDKPKVLFADSVSASEDTILIGDLAKFLRQNGIDIGQNRLFERLRNEGFLHRTGTRWNTPTQKAMDMGLFEVQERVIQKPDGSPLLSQTTKVTGKGQLYFINHYLRQEEVKEA